MNSSNCCRLLKKAVISNCSRLIFSSRLKSKKMSTQASKIVTSLPKVPAPVPDVQNNKLLAAVVDDDLASLQAVAENDEIIDEPDEWHNSPLIWAAELGKAEIVEFLGKHKKVDIHRRGYLGNTALSRACRRGHTEVVRILLDAADEKSAFKKGNQTNTER